MNLSAQEKRLAVVGAIAVGAILLLAFVIVPLAESWSDMGTRLEKRLPRIRQLQEKAAEREDLLHRRQVLVRAMGSLAGPPPSAGGRPAGSKGAPPKAQTSAPSPATAEKAAPGAATTNEKGPDRSAQPPKSEPQSAANPEPAAVPAKPEAPGPAKSETPALTKNETPAPKTETAGPPGSPTVEAAGPSGPPGPSKAEMPGPASPGKGDTAPSGTATKAGKPAPSSVRLATYVERTAGQSGVSLKGATPKERTGAAGRTSYFQAMNVRVTFDCGIQDLVKFLHALEKGERFVHVDRLELRRDAKRGDALSVTLDLAGYQLAEP